MSYEYSDEQEVLSPVLNRLHKKLKSMRTSMNHTDEAYGYYNGVSDSIKVLEEEMNKYGV